MLQRLVNQILNLLLPAVCLACGRDGTYLCFECLGDLPRPDVEADETIIAAFDYSDQRVKKTVWLLKYRGVSSLAPVLARAIFDRASESLAEISAFFPSGSEPWLVIPIPLARGRRRRRGFNQAEELAKHFCVLSPADFVLEKQLLSKVRETRSQVEIKDRRRRLMNLRGAFALAAPECVRGRKILLVDDVITTGGTINEARKILQAAGARVVVAAAVAHG